MISGWESWGDTSHQGIVKQGDEMASVGQNGRLYEKADCVRKQNDDNSRLETLNPWY